ncbi:MAG TPA: penicillin-binding transpeptidase domain-containing protein [Thermoanaerobaculia bacterium]|nr:penicillin-binding transpeptidase domain-containing protein [Thermoanaerobaculia bacterium]
MIAFSSRRLRFFGLALAVWALVVVGRLAQIQIAQGAKYRARAQRQQERRIEVPPRRGPILDREGRELAISVEASSVYVVLEEIERPEKTAAALASLVDLPASTIAARIRQKIDQKKVYVRVARQIDSAVADVIRARKIPGVQLVPEPKRYYPKGSLAASVLGYVGTDDVGLAGLEYFYDSTVRGRPGEIVALTDARRSAYGEAESAEGSRGQEGATLVLSLDSGVQFLAERELLSVVAETHAKSGSVVLLDPNTGEIFAMANAPTFDPNQYGRYPAEARRNHAAADAYEPGSTFKIVTGATALDQRVVSMNEVFSTDGAIRIGNVTINEDKHHDYGDLTLSGIFERSSNVGIIRVGLRLGPERLYEGASAFGVGRSTGVDLPGESTGIFRPLARWSFLSNASISMGQEVAVTALQLARMAAVVANGGRLVTPHLVTRVIASDGRVRIPATAPPTRVISEETAAKLREILVGVVERGTGNKAAIPGFTVAGKTGTAQKAGVGGYQAGRHVPNFVGFVPAEKPRLVGVVVLEEPEGKYYAAEVACPLFSRIVGQALGVLRIAPESQRVPQTVLAYSTQPAYPAGVVPAAQRGPERANFSAVSAVSAREDTPDRVPDVVGLSARQALSLFARLGMRARLAGTGFVASQTPLSGSLLRPGQTVTLRLSETAPWIRGLRGREETSSSLPSP